MDLVSVILAIGKEIFKIFASLLATALAKATEFLGDVTVGGDLLGMLLCHGYSFTMYFIIRVISLVLIEAIMVSLSFCDTLASNLYLG